MTAYAAAGPDGGILAHVGAGLDNRAGRDDRTGADDRVGGNPGAGVDEGRGMNTRLTRRKPRGRSRSHVDSRSELLAIHERKIANGGAQRTTGGLADGHA